MHRRILGMGLLLIAVGTPLLAQDNAGLQPIFDRIDKLEQRLQESMEKRFADVESMQTNHSTEIRKNSEQIDQLKQDFQAVQRDYSDLLQRLDQVTEQGSSGEWNLKIVGNMETRPEFRHQMQKAVNDSIAPMGRVVVTNFMDSWQRIVVNGEARWVPPSAGKEEVFTVAVGTITTVIPGFEGQKNWTLTAPSYLQRIDIVPRHTAAFAPAEQPSNVVVPPVQTANYAPIRSVMMPVAPVTNYQLLP